MNRDITADKLSTQARGFAQSGVRIANERVVLTLIGLNPGSSNADLARLSGLGPQTTSRIVVELESRGLINRGDVLRGRRGQPATPLFLNPDGAYTFGVEIGWRHIEVLLFSMAGKTLASVRRSYKWPDATTIVGLVAAEIATITAGMSESQRERLSGIGVASPAHIYRNVCRLGAPPEQARLWENFDLVARIERATGQSAHWFSHGNCASWSEMIARPSPRPPNFVSIHVGTLLAAGIVIGGELWRGPTGSGADLGTIMVPDGASQPTSAHLVASIFALEQALDKAGISVPTGNPLNWDWDQLEPVASVWIDDAGRAIAQALISTLGVLDFDSAIVGGTMPRHIVELLVKSVHHYVDVLPTFSGMRPNVDIGVNGASAAAIGAAQLVLFQRYFSRAMDIFVA